MAKRDGLPPGFDRLPSGRIRPRYRDSDGRQHGATFDGIREAQRWRGAQVADVDRGTHVAAADGREHFKDNAESWRLAQVHRPSTAAHVETMLRRHVYPVLGDRPIASIRPSHVQALIKGMTATLQPSTVHVVHAILAGIFKAAVRDRVIASSPCTSTSLPKIPRREVVPLATETVHALAAAVPAHMRALVLLAAGTGLRHGEAVGLTLDRVNMLRRTVRVDRQLSTVDGRPFMAPPKTEASTRTVPMPQVVVDALAAHLSSYPAKTHEVPVRRTDGPTEPVELIFTTARGYPIRRTTFGDIWRTAVTEAGAPHGTGFHALRHYYASVLIESGASIKVVQHRLGHASAAMTLDVYSHLWPDTEDTTRAAIDAVLGSAGKSVTESVTAER